MVCVQILELLEDLFHNLLCGMFCGHLYATTGLEDQAVIA